MGICKKKVLRKGGTQNTNAWNRDDAGFGTRGGERSAALTRKKKSKYKDDEVWGGVFSYELYVKLKPG